MILTKLARTRGLLGRMIRLTTYVLAITLVLGFVAVRRAKAGAEAGALAIGERLLAMQDPDDGDDAVHELTLNGQTLHIASAQTTRSVDEVLGRFQAQCEDHADGMARDLERLTQAVDAPPTTIGYPGVGVLRDDRAGRGVVACFATGQPTDHLALAARLDRFAQTHDLADLGGLRYVAARRLEGGGTLVVATWTDRPFRLDEVFPASDRDAAGDDPQVAPRPGGGRRMLSARDGRSANGVTLYEMPEPPALALDRYAAQMKSRGFRPPPPGPQAALAERAPETRAFERAGVDVLVTATREDGVTLLSVVEMPAARVARRAR